MTVHTTLRHPLTGEMLHPVYIDKSGRERWPIMGGSEEEDEAKAKEEAEAKAKEEAEAKAKAEEEAKAKEGEHGFPADTPLEQMTGEQQTAYWKYRARKNEDIGKSLRSAVGDLTPDQVKAKLEEADKIARERMTEQEKAVEDARKEARESAIAEATPRLVSAAFDIALGDMADDERAELIDTLDLRKFVDDNGTVDTAKVKATATRLAGAATGSGNHQRADYGAGRRSGTKTSGVDAGREMFERDQAKSAPVEM